MRDVTLIPEDRAVGCNTQDCQREMEHTVEPKRPIGDGGKEKGRIICDRMWPETCYICDSGVWPMQDGPFTHCRKLTPDPCKRDPIDPGHDVLPKKCYEQPPAGTHKENSPTKPEPKTGKETKPEQHEKREEKSGSYVPSGDFYSWTDSFDRFSESYDGYMEEGDGLALRDKDEDDADSADDKPEKPEREAPDRDWRDDMRDDYQERTEQLERQVREYPWADKAEQARTEALDLLDKSAAKQKEAFTRNIEVRVGNKGADASIELKGFVKDSVEARQLLDQAEKKAEEARKAHEAAQKQKQTNQKK